jgi:hypothetical protein
MVSVCGRGWGNPASTKIFEIHVTFISSQVVTKGIGGFLPPRKVMDIGSQDFLFIGVKSRCTN